MATCCQCVPKMILVGESLFDVNKVTEVTLCTRYARQVDDPAFPDFNRIVGYDLRYQMGNKYLLNPVTYPTKTEAMTALQNFRDGHYDCLEPSSKEVDKI